jgi:hypothetical protein
VIDINLTRGLVALLALALLMAALVGYLTWGQREAAASGPQAPLDRARDRPLASSAGMRQFYLTATSYNGAEADGTDGNGAGVCASGYHFASLWEILDPSNLKYNITLGSTLQDSGQGPPSNMDGWVRTGYASDYSGVPGWTNCSAWTNSSTAQEGTWVMLSRDWTTGQDIHVWEADYDTCANDKKVWCVED